MKHCKTLFVLVAATIVMLTSGCARQTVHPVPIRYNFLDHIPDYDPMLLDTESVSEPHSVAPDTARMAAFGAAKKSPVPVSYRFRVEAGPDREPELPGNTPGGELAGSAVTAVPVVAKHRVRFQFKPEATPDEDPMLRENATLVCRTDELVEPAATAVPVVVKHRFRFQFKPEATPDEDPMLLENATLVWRTDELVEPAATAVPVVAKHRVRFQFKPEATPDEDPMLLGTNISPIAEEVDLVKTPREAGYRMVQRHPAQVRYQFRLEHIPDYDPMLQITESVANTGSTRRDSTLAATSASVKSYR